MCLGVGDSGVQDFIVKSYPQFLSLWWINEIQEHLLHLSMVCLQAKPFDFLSWMKMEEKKGFLTGKKKLFMVLRWWNNQFWDHHSGNNDAAIKKTIAIPDLGENKAA